MKVLETQHLILRKFTPEDFAAVHSYAACLENVVYMPFGPNSEAETRAFIARAIANAEKEPCASYEYAATLKTSGQLVGGCSLILKGDDGAEIGWILHRKHWRRGYGSEMGAALLAFGFGTLGLHRIIACCDAENIASYRVMEKIGMRREGLFIEARPAHKLSTKPYSDELLYAITSPPLGASTCPVR